eukprot:scaffold3454_cov68-Phaeocystis_antarctica.AAC.4
MRGRRATDPPPRHPARTSPHIVCPLSIRQDAHSLSDANKLLIRCAWAGNLAFDSEYDSSWGPGSCA